MSLDERQVRLQKLERLCEEHRNPYPKDPVRTHLCANALEFFESLSASAEEVILAGRILTIRVHGGMLFADLVDESGKMQLAFRQDDIGETEFVAFRDLMDPGDFVEAHGILFTTKRGEKSLQVKMWRPLAKALSPLPEKWHGLQDVELRYRARELDLLSHPEVKERFVVRSKLVSAMRRFLDGNGFLEVETPMLHPIPGGANARPFVTHHNALDADFYIRIAPELYLKRLLVGGFERIYEIGRCFRNEGIDHTHNPEFTMMELYWAYAGKERFITFLEQLLQTIVLDVFQTTEIQIGGQARSFRGPFERRTFHELLLFIGLDIDQYPTEEAVRDAVKQLGLGVDLSDSHGRGECLDEVFKKKVRPSLMGPLWVLDYPADMKPLANVSEDPTKSACAQLLLDGAEVVNAYYHELNDPLEQRRRLTEQQALADGGSEEAQRLDEAFLQALEHGMPPASGVGIGIDRLVSLLTQVSSLKEAILFPTLRPLTEEKTHSDLM